MYAKVVQFIIRCEAKVPPTGMRICNENVIISIFLCRQGWFASQALNQLLLFRFLLNVANIVLSLVRAYHFATPTYQSFTYRLSAMRSTARVVVNAETKMIIYRGIFVIK